MCADCRRAKAQSNVNGLCSFVFPPAQRKAEVVRSDLYREKYMNKISDY